MAQAVEQYIPLDQDRWTLDQAFHYLTVNLGYPKERALDEMEQQRLAGHLVVQIHKVVDGKPQGDPEYLPPDKKHKLVLDLGWIRPLALKWGSYRYTVYKQRVLELCPSRSPVSQLAQDQQPEGKTGSDSLKFGAGPPPTVQRRPAKVPKPDSGAKPRREPSTAQAARDAAIKRRLVSGARPGVTVPWNRFCHAVRMECDAFIGDPKDPKGEKYKRGFTDDTIEDVTRELMKSLPRQA
jgi:hypothetical protein